MGTLSLLWPGSSFLSAQTLLALRNSEHTLGSWLRTCIAACLHNYVFLGGLVKHQLTLIFVISESCRVEVNPRLGAPSQKRTLEAFPCSYLATRSINTMRCNGWGGTDAHQNAPIGQCCPIRPKKSNARSTCSDNRVPQLLGST
jgi:hypothetical protein